MSSLPKRSSASATTFCAADSVATSPTNGTMRLLSLKISTTAGLMSSATTIAPRACSSSTVARPMPLAAPVTMATLSFRSEEHTSELQSQSNLVCRLLLEKKKTCYPLGSTLVNLEYLTVKKLLRVLPELLDRSPADV